MTVETFGGLLVALGLGAWLAIAAHAAYRDRRREQRRTAAVLEVADVAHLNHATAAALVDEAREFLLDMLAADTTPGVALRACHAYLEQELEDAVPNRGRHLN